MLAGPRRTTEMAAETEPNPVRTIALVSESQFTAKDHGVHTAFVEQLRALQQLGQIVAVNNVAACRRADLTVVHTPGPYAGGCLRAAGARGVAYAHVTPRTLAQSLKLEPLWRPFARAYLRRFYREAPRVVAVSPVVRHELLELGIDGDTIVEIPNGIDVERIAQPPDQQLLRRIQSTGRPGRPLVLGVGQLQPRKGVDRFVGVARSVRDCDFVWVGGRPFKGLTESVSLGELPPNLRLAGRVSDLELLAYYHAADIFLFPSRQENFGQVVVEAAAAGLPLVLSDLEVFEKTFGSAALRCRDERELAAIVTRLASDRSFRLARSAAARELAERFTARAGAQALLELVDELPASERVERPIPAPGGPL